MTRAALLLAWLLLVGCGGSGGEEGTASLWITRDRGATVLFEGEVAAGQTVMQALQRSADVETSYGGRFVQSIDDLGGSVARQVDWFYFVNGYEADVGASEYRLRAGDVAWWDYRSWRTRMHYPIVVGAFPEPFLHGYRGERRAAAVRYRLPRQRESAERLADAIGADSVDPASVPVPPDSNVLRLETGPARFVARLRRPGGTAGDAVEFVLAGDVERVADDPAVALRRYEGLP